MRVQLGSIAHQVMEALPGQAMEPQTLIYWRHLNVTVTRDETGQARANLFFSTSNDESSTGASYQDRLTGIESAIRYSLSPNKEAWETGFLEADAPEIEAFRIGDRTLGKHEADIMDRRLRLNGLTAEDKDNLRNDHPLVLKISVALDPVSDNQNFKALMAFLAPKDDFVISPDVASKIRRFVTRAAANDDTPIPPTASRKPVDQSAPRTSP
ncbi:MAG: hypothetical protein AAF569_02850 [Pseudomonadota bacterium]